MALKKYTKISELKAIASLLCDFQEKKRGYNFIDSADTTEGAHTHTPYDQPETIGIASLDEPSVVVYGRNLGCVSGRVLPYNESRRDKRWATVIGGQEDVDKFERLMAEYKS